MADSWEDLDLEDLAIDVPEPAAAEQEASPAAPVDEGEAASAAKASSSASEAGPTVDHFIAQVLSCADRGYVVEWEADLESFVCDPKAKQRDYPPMPRHQREILIRVAHSFQLLYEVKSNLPGVERLPVTLFKTPNSCVPTTKLSGINVRDLPLPSAEQPQFFAQPQEHRQTPAGAPPKIQIMKRAQPSNVDKEKEQLAKLGKSIKSVEQREMEYQQARAKLGLK